MVDLVKIRKKAKKKDEVRTDDSGLRTESSHEGELQSSPPGESQPSQEEETHSALTPQPSLLRPRLSLLSPRTNSQSSKRKQASDANQSRPRRPRSPARHRSSKCSRS